MTAKVILDFGASFTGKSTHACSAVELLKPGERVFYMELDPGSFERTGHDPEDPRFEVKYYYAPASTLLERGKVSGAGISRPLHGWDALWWQFVDDFLKAANDPTVPTIIVDTGTKAWLLCRNAYFERVQNEKDDKARERLARLEYQEPNGQFDAIVTTAKVKDTRIIFIAHQGEVYQNDKPTGELKPDGYKELAGMADITLQFRIRNKKPEAVIYKIGAGGMELKDMVLASPTVESVEALLVAAAKLRRAGKDLPDSPQGIMVDSLKV